MVATALSVLVSSTDTAEFNTIDNLPHISNTAAVSNRSRTVENDSEHLNLKQQLNNYYSWVSSNEDKQENYDDFQHGSLDGHTISGSESSLRRKPSSQEELADSRRRALQRLTEKRREMQTSLLKQYELEKFEENVSRVRWRGGLRKKRLQEIDDHVDRILLHDCIKNDPMLLLGVLSSNNDDINSLDEQWSELLDGLSFEISTPPPPISQSAASSPSMRVREKVFNQESKKTSRMMKAPSEVLYQPSAKAFLQKIVSTICGVPVLSFRPSSITDDVSDMFSLANPPSPSVTMSPYDKFSLDQLEHESDDIMYATRKTRRSSGLLSKYIEKVNVDTSIRGEKLRQTIIDEGGYYLVPGHYEPSTETGPNLCGDPTISQYFYRYAETVHVAGPSADEIQRLVNSASKKFWENNRLADSTKLSITESVLPVILFATKFDKEVSIESLATFSFPGYVDILTFQRLT